LSFACFATYHVDLRCFTAGVGNPRPASQMRPAWTFDMVRVRTFVPKLDTISRQNEAP